MSCLQDRDAHDQAPGRHWPTGDVRQGHLSSTNPQHRRSPGWLMCLPVFIAVLLAMLFLISPTTGQETKRQEGKAEELSIEQLTEKLKSADKSERLQAAQQLASKGKAARGAVPMLIETLHDDDLQVSLAAAATLGELGPEAEEAIGPLIERMGKSLVLPGNDPASKYYSEALGRIGKSAVPQLIEATRSENAWAWRGAFESLHAIGPDAIESLPRILEVLEEEGGVTQKLWAAVYVIEGMGPAAAEAIDSLIPLLKHEDFQIQVITCRALAAMGPAARPAVAELARLLEEGVLSARSQAAMTLGSIGVVEEVDTIELLLPKTTNFYDVMRDRSLIGLGRLGTDAERIAPQILELVNDKGYRNRPRAAWAHWKVTGEPEQAVEFLAARATDVIDGAQAMAILSEIGPSAIGAKAALIEVLKEDNIELQMEAAIVLQQIGPAAVDAVEFLEPLTNHSDPELAEIATETIAILKEKG